MEKHFENWVSWYPWALAGSCALLGLACALLWVNTKTRRREQAIRAFLDTADALERDLLDCKKRMQELESWVSSLPGEKIQRNGFSLNSEASVQEARKLLLGQRLWLRDHHEGASLSELQTASSNLDRSRLSLAEHMSKLERVRAELERATDSLEHAYRNQDKLRTGLIVGGNNSVH